MAPTLLVELLTEELPPKALKRLGEAFAEGIRAGLHDGGFLDADSKTTAFATPRRLAVSITNVRPEAEDKEIVLKLLPAATAVDAAGKPSQALRKRLEKIGRAPMADGYPDVWDGPDHLYVETDGKADYAWLRSLAKGGSLLVGLQDVLEESIEKLPIPKVMSYQRPDGATVKFARPAHRLVALHGSDIVAVTALGLEAGRTTGGHRFLGRVNIDLASADAYEPTLEAEGKVVPSFAKRLAEIVAGLERAAEHARVIMPDALLDEVTGLVESPTVYAGTFDRTFLDVPQECLILTMQQNQKYFALADENGKLKHRFLVVSNLRADDPSAIIHGNERVLHARLADAKFFYDQDRRRPLEARLPELANVVYYSKLGSELDHVTRIRAIAAAIARETGADPVAADRAAMLAKADLITGMVGEFPELQGTMGRYYALHDGETPTVADAIEQHYWPRFAGDALPQGPVAATVALADKIETLAGMFGIGNVPTGEKDPLGLRRAALGVLRILMEGNLPLRLDHIIDAGFAAFSGTIAVEHAHGDLEAFMFDRLRSYLREQGYTANQIEAVVSTRPVRIDQVLAQMRAVKTFVTLPEAESLAAANKRIVNILKKSESDAAAAVDRSLVGAGAEHDLYAAVQKLLPVVHNHVDRGDYTEALRALASARGVVDRFFDDVMVMADDRALRANRLALLRGLAEAMNQVADISKLAV